MSYQQETVGGYFFGAPCDLNAYSYKTRPTADMQHISEHKVVAEF